MIRKEQIIIGTKEEILDYFRTDLNIVLRIDREMWDEKIKKGLEESEHDAYKKFLDKTVTGSREVGDLRIDKQLDSAQAYKQVFYFEASPETVVDDTPTVELILTSIHVRVIRSGREERI